MEYGDAQETNRLLRQLCETQVANLEVQRKLLDIVAAQTAHNEETSRRFLDRATLLQDRTMELLVLNRRVLSFGLPVFAVIVVLFAWGFVFGGHR